MEELRVHTLLHAALRAMKDKRASMFSRMELWSFRLSKSRENNLIKFDKERNLPIKVSCSSDPAPKIRVTGSMR